MRRCDRTAGSRHRSQRAGGKLRQDKAEQPPGASRPAQLHSPGGGGSGEPPRAATGQGAEAARPAQAPPAPPRQPGVPGPLHGEGCQPPRAGRKGGQKERLEEPKPQESHPKGSPGPGGSGGRDGSRHRPPPPPSPRLSMKLLNERDVTNAVFSLLRQVAKQQAPAANPRAGRPFRRAATPTARRPAPRRAAGQWRRPLQPKHRRRPMGKGRRRRRCQQQRGGEGEGEVAGRGRNSRGSWKIRTDGPGRAGRAAAANQGARGAGAGPAAPPPRPRPRPAGPSAARRGAGRSGATHGGAAPSGSVRRAPPPPPAAAALPPRRHHPPPRHVGEHGGAAAPGHDQPVRAGGRLRRRPGQAAPAGGPLAVRDCFECVFSRNQHSQQPPPPSDDVHPQQHPGHSAQLPGRARHVLQAADLRKPPEQQQPHHLHGLLAAGQLQPLLGLVAPQPPARLAAALVAHGPRPPPPPAPPGARLAPGAAARRPPAESRGHNGRAEIRLGRRRGVVGG